MEPESYTRFLRLPFKAYLVPIFFTNLSTTTEQGLKYIYFSYNNILYSLWQGLSLVFLNFLSKQKY